jgi:hypothetical protein
MKRCCEDADIIDVKTLKSHEFISISQQCGGDMAGGESSMRMQPMSFCRVGGGAVPEWQEGAGRMSDATGDDDDFDLGISIETVATVVDHLRALQETESEKDEAAEIDDIEGEEELDEDTLATFIEELNEDEQAALVALAWVGRGDYEPDQWEEAVAMAKERGAGTSTADYLIQMDLAADLLAEGLGAFGLSIEDIER